MQPVHVARKHHVPPSAHKLLGVDGVFVPPSAQLFSIATCHWFSILVLLVPLFGSATFGTIIFLLAETIGATFGTIVSIWAFILLISLVPLSAQLQVDLERDFAIRGTTFLIQPSRDVQVPPSAQLFPQCSNDKPSRNEYSKRFKKIKNQLASL